MRLFRGRGLFDSVAAIDGQARNADLAVGGGLFHSVIDVNGQWILVQFVTGRSEIQHGGLAVAFVQFFPGVVGM